MRLPRAIVALTLAMLPLAGLAAEPAAHIQAVDREIAAALNVQNLPVSPPADDAELLRRLYLDLHGVIPPSEKVVAFLDDSRPDKRAIIIDELLASPRFGQHMADLWSGYLSPPNVNQRIPTPLFTAWLAQAFNDLTWDKLVYALLTATGTPEDNGAIVYMLRARDPVTPAEMANTSTRYFLGVQLACAQCHDHPFTSYKKDDFWGVASFFSQFEMPGQGRLRRFGIVDNTSGSYHLVNYEDRHELGDAHVLGATAAADRSAVLRPVFAQWVTSPENPYFAKAMANRMWWHLFGRGLVDPVDDMHPDNPASHPALLDLLARQFAESGFDLKQLCRTLCNTQAYQRTSRPVTGNEADEKWYSHMAIKVLSPQQLYDSLSAVFGEPSRPQSGAAGRGRNDPRAEFVAFFAREPNASPLSYEQGIPQLLRMMNSSQFFDRASRGEPRGMEEAYLRVLSRRPTAEEAKLCRDHLHQGGQMREIVWALVNSSEFCLNR